MGKLDAVRGQSPLDLVQPMHAHLPPTQKPTPGTCTSFALSHTPADQNTRQNTPHTNTPAQPHLIARPRTPEQRPRVRGSTIAGSAASQAGMDLEEVHAGVVELKFSDDAQPFHATEQHRQHQVAVPAENPNPRLLAVKLVGRVRCCSRWL